MQANTPNPNPDSMTEGMQLVIFRVVDVDRELAFYHEALGLEIAGHTEGRIAQVRLTPVTNLELISGGSVVPPVSDRAQSPSTIVFRVGNVEQALERIVKHGGTIVNQPFPVGNQRVAYVADPEGHLIGLSDLPSA